MCGDNVLHVIYMFVRRSHPFRINVRLGSAAPIIKYLLLTRINICSNERFVLSRALPLPICTNYILLT